MVAATVVTLKHSGTRVRILQRDGDWVLVANADTGDDAGAGGSMKRWVHEDMLVEEDDNG